MEAIKKKIVTLKTEVDTLTEETEQLVTEKKTLIDELGEITDSVEENKRKLKMVEMKLKSEKGKETGLKSKIQSLESQVSSKDQTEGDANDDVDDDELERQIIETKSEVKRIEAEIFDRERTISVKKAEIQKQNNLNTQYEAKIKRLENDLNALDRDDGADEGPGDYDEDSMRNKVKQLEEEIREIVIKRENVERSHLNTMKCKKTLQHEVDLLNEKIKGIESFFN